MRKHQTTLLICGLTATLNANPDLATLNTASLNAASIKNHPYPNIKINRSGSQETIEGPDEEFSGSVEIDQLFEPAAPGRTLGEHVLFEPASRTAWHSHPLGQVLIITSGIGLVQTWGGPIEEVNEGDVIHIPPGVKHWHGATFTTPMSHISVTEEHNGNVVTVMEHVADDQYAL